MTKIPPMPARTFLRNYSRDLIELPQKKIMPGTSVGYIEHFVRVDNRSIPNNIGVVEVFVLKQSGRVFMGRGFQDDICASEGEAGERGRLDTGRAEVGESVSYRVHGYGGGIVQVEFAHQIRAMFRHGLGT
jgi:hypothetical protein